MTRWLRRQAPIIAPVAAALSALAGGAAAGTPLASLQNEKHPSGKQTPSIQTLNRLLVKRKQRVRLFRV